MSWLWPGRRARRVFVITLAFVAGALGIGAIWQARAVRRERAQFPPPGKLVDVGGRRLHYVCIGSGEPTVMFESSGFGSALSAEKARTEISQRTRVCSYDRMGMGWSDPGPSVISAGLLADDLAHLLAAADIKPPYILVPSSIGGLTSEVFARRHPRDVSGLVFLDAAQSEGAADLSSRVGTIGRTAMAAAACVPKFAAAVGLLRLIDPMNLRHQQGGDRGVAVLYRTEPMRTLCGIVRGWDATMREFASTPPLRADVPLVVLTAETTENLAPAKLAWLLGSSITRDRIAIQQRFAKRSTRGTWQLVPGSDHLIASSQPRAVAAAVLNLISQLH
jgi:pimeloyl-ACP methyl ester carboxylesterase